MNNTVEKMEEIFTSFHQIILSFIFELGVFLPPLVNAVLVGFAVGNFSNENWGLLAALISGPIAGGAIEVMGVALSWNLQGLNYWLIPLYVGGSWVLILFGLPIEKTITTIGIIMPIFAVAAQNIVSKRKEKQSIIIQEKEKASIELAELKEKTKQERAKARAARLTQNLAQNDTKKSKTEILEWLKNNPDTSTREVIYQFGISDQTVRNYKKELNGNGK